MISMRYPKATWLVDQTDDSLAIAKQSPNNSRTVKFRYSYKENKKQWQYNQMTIVGLSHKRKESYNEN